GAEPALVKPLVDALAPVRGGRSGHAPPERLSAFVVKGFRRAHPNVVAAVRLVEPEGGEELLALGDDVVDVLFRRAAEPGRRARYVQAVLVRPRHETGPETA